MAYVRTHWVNDVTKLNADNMNNIEEGIAEAMSKASAEYLIKILKESGTNASKFTVTGKNASGEYSTVFEGKPIKYVKESAINGKILSITNVNNDVESTISYGADTGEFALQSDLNKEIQDRKDADNLKVTSLLKGTNGKSLIFNESDGGGAKFEGDNHINSYVGVHDGSGNNILAQIYAINNDTNKCTIIDVKENKAYYYTGAIKAASDRDKDENEIAIKNDINVEKLRAEGAESDLTTAISDEKDRAEGAEQTLEGKFDSYYPKQTGATGEEKDKVTYNAKQIDDLISAKADDFNIDTDILEWVTETGKLRKLTTKFGQVIELVGQVESTSELPTSLTASNVGDMYLVGSETASKRDMYVCVPVTPATTPATYHFTRCGDTSITLTDYWKIADGKNYVTEALKTKQDKLVDKTNISTLGANLTNQKSLLTSKVIVIKIKGGKLSSGYTNIHIKVQGTNCTCEGVNPFEEDRVKSALEDLIMWYDADAGTHFVADDLTVKLDGTVLVKDTDYEYDISKEFQSRIEFTSTGLAKLKATGAQNLVIEPVAADLPTP